jgi:hypothetical protein
MICTLPRGEGGEREGYTTINTLFNITNIKTRFHINARGTMAVISFATSHVHTHLLFVILQHKHIYTHHQHTRDLHCTGGKGSNFFFHAVRKALVHSGS